MIRFHFGHEDLVRTRFAISPLFDLNWSTDVLRDPAAHSLHLPWARAARRRLEGFDYALLDLLATRRRTATCPTSSPRPPRRRWPSSTTSSRACARRRPSRSRSRSAGASRDAGVPPAARALLDDPQRGLAELTAVMADYFERAIAPWWPEIRAALEATSCIARGASPRGRDRGVRGSPSQVRWRDGALEVERRLRAATWTCAGAGCCSCPPRSRGRGCSRWSTSPGSPRWSTRRAGSGRCGRPPTGRRREALADLLGRRRAAILRDAGDAGGDERSGAAPRRVGGRRQRAPGGPAPRRAGAAPPATGGACSTRARPPATRCCAAGLMCRPSVGWTRAPRGSRAEEELVAGARRARGGRGVPGARCRCSSGGRPRARRRRGRATRGGGASRGLRA